MTSPESFAVICLGNVGCLSDKAFTCRHSSEDPLDKDTQEAEGESKTTAAVPQVVADSKDYDPNSSRRESRIVVAQKTARGTLESPPEHVSIFYFIPWGESPSSFG